MKKQFFTAVGLLVFLAAGAENKFDARSEIIASEYTRFIKNPTHLLLSPDELPFSTDILSRSGNTVSAAVILADGVSRDQIEDAGLSITVATKSVMVVEGSMEDIIRLADSDMVKSVSFAEEFQPMLDYARQFTGVATIHEGGDGLPQAYTGKGVITAIFDNGFYPDHINFKDENNKCRITNFWHYKGDDGKNPVHYDSPENVITITNSTDSKSSSHGTHTLGCMAGHSYKNVKSYAYFDQRSGSDEVIVTNPILDKNGVAVPFSGMAKDAEIIAAAGTLSNLNMMAGIKEMADYIEASGKPGVINLSLGTMIGPRDGSDAFTMFLDEIAEKVPVFVAAGNDGDQPYSISGESFKTFIYSENTSENIQGVLDIWGSDDQFFDASIAIYDQSQAKIVYTYPITSLKQEALGNNNIKGVTVSDKAFEDAFTSSYLLIMPKKLETNNRCNLYIQYTLKNNQTTNSEGNYAVGVIINGKNGQRIDLAHRIISGNGELTDLGQTGWSSGNSDMTINSMACGHNTLAIGAWNSRNAWAITPSNRYFYPDPEKEGLLLDEVAGYSSYGELYDGRRKPDFTAPGTGIISSVSTPGKSSLMTGSYPCATYSSGSRSDMWGIMQGTSMATPIVAGAVALWLEADPSLTPAQIRDIAISSCKTDSYTSTGNPLRWGAGKFDALAGLKKILSLSGISDITADSHEKVIVTATGNNCWNVFAAGADKVNARIFNISGIAVSEYSANGEELIINTSDLSSGIYILNVNGNYSTRISVK